MGIVGSATFQAIVLYRVAAAHPDAATQLLKQARAAGFLAALFLLLGTGLRLLAQLHSLVEPGEPITRELLDLLLGSEWGHAWKIQAGVALGTLIFIPLIRSTLVLVPLAAAVVTVFPLTGHAAEHPWGAKAGVLLHGIHQLGGGMWIGALVLVVVAGYGSTRKLETGERHRVIATLVHSYSPVALVGVGTAVLIGLVLGYGYLHSVSAIWATAYGRTLLVKTGFLAGTAAIGAYNWRRVRPTLGESVASERLFRSATMELILGALLLGATAVLVALPAPAME
jgi:copper transport protein